MSSAIARCRSPPLFPPRYASPPLIRIVTGKRTWRPQKTEPSTSGMQTWTSLSSESIAAFTSTLQHCFARWRHFALQNGCDYDCHTPSRQLTALKFAKIVQIRIGSKVLKTREVKYRLRRFIFVSEKRGCWISPSGAKSDHHHHHHHHYISRSS